MYRRRVSLFAIAPAVLLAAASLLLVADRAAVAVPPAPLGPQSADTPSRLFAWFDTLGYPDLTRARFVRFGSDAEALAAIGVTAEPGGYAGFLLVDDPTSFSLFSLRSLEVEDHQETAFDDYDFAAYIEE